MLSKFLGIPFFLLILYAVFAFSTGFGAMVGDFLDLTFGVLLVDFPSFLVTKVTNLEIVREIIQAVGGGIQAVASFVPIIFCVYLSLAILENSGYISRAAVITNKLMAFSGLSAQSFFPLVVGLSCNVPAVSASRIIPNKRQRITTIMMAPFLSCAAR